jgi:hypothetical protein
MKISNSVIAVIDLLVIFLAVWGIAAALTPALPEQRKVYCELPYFVSSKEVHVLAGMCNLGDIP